MESLNKSIQVPFLEILSILASKHLKNDQEGNSLENLFRMSSKVEEVEIWVRIKEEDNELGFADSEHISVKNEPIHVDKSDQNVFIFSFPIRGALDPYPKIKRKSRRPGPNLRPH